MTSTSRSSGDRVGTSMGGSGGSSTGNAGEGSGSGVGAGAGLGGLATLMTAGLGPVGGGQRVAERSFRQRTAAAEALIRQHAAHATALHASMQRLHWRQQSVKAAHTWVGWGCRHLGTVAAVGQQRRSSRHASQVWALVRVVEGACQLLGSAQIGLGQRAAASLRQGGGKKSRRVRHAPSAQHGSGTAPCNHRQLRQHRLLPSQSGGAGSAQIRGSACCSKNTGLRSQKLAAAPLCMNVGELKECYSRFEGRQAAAAAYSMPALPAHLSSCTLSAWLSCCWRRCSAVKHCAGSQAPGSVLKVPVRGQRGREAAEANDWATCSLVASKATAGCARGSVYF